MPPTAWGRLCGVSAPLRLRATDAKRNCNQNCNQERIEVRKVTMKAQFGTGGAPGARTLNPRIKSPLLCH